jgi:hypothetical protein
VNSTEYDGYLKPGAHPMPGLPADITIAFADVNLFGKVDVYDVWARQSLGVFEGSYTAAAVPFQGTAFLRLSAATGTAWSTGTTSTTRGRLAARAGLTGSGESEFKLAGSLNGTGSLRLARCQCQCQPDSE